MWDRMVTALDTCTAEAGAGLVVMTPDEWDEMVGVMWGDFDDAVRDVQRTLTALGPDEGFAVYSNYRLKASVAPELPESDESVAREGGAWVVLDQQGRVVSRFSDWSETDGQD